MIFWWIIKVLKRVIWFFKIPRPQDVARIDPQSPCPVCGNKCHSRIRCVWQQEDGPLPPAKEPRLQLKNTKVLCQHVCGLCGARWFEQPVMKVDTTTVLPSVPRDELESKEDRSAMLQSQG